MMLGADGVSSQSVLITHFEGLPVSTERDDVICQIVVASPKNFSSLAVSGLEAWIQWSNEYSANLCMLNNK